MSASGFSPRRFLDDAGGRISEDGLIRFDHRVIILLAVLLACFIAFVALTLNLSSVSEWNSIIVQSPAATPDLLWGSAKKIRSDEWLVTTPFTLSQAAKGFPVENPNIGPHADTLLTNQPAAHFSTMMRPQHWGYFLFGVERGFSFYWAYKVFALLASFFLLLMLLTRNNFWISVAGMLWLYFSSYIQWWFSTIMPELLIAFSIFTIAILYIMLSRRTAFVLIAAGIFAAFSFSFTMAFYPPFQVAIVYLAAFIIAGVLMERKRWPQVRSRLWFRLTVLAGSLLALAVLLALFYRDAASTIDAIKATVYPGKRLATGGDIGLVKLFSGITGVPYGESGFPASWENASEASGFLMAFPVVLAGVVWNIIRRRGNGPLMISLSVYVAAMMLWTLAGFPEKLAVASLLGNVPAFRAIFGIGVASLILTTIFLSQGYRADSRDRLFATGAALAVLGLVLWYGTVIRNDSPEFFHNSHIVIMAIFAAVVSFLLLIRNRAGFFLAVLTATIILTATVNPVSTGLAAIFDKDVARTAAAVNQDNPGSKWITYGDPALASFLKASGIDVVNGYFYTPDLDFYRVLDPAGTSADIYNRYGQVDYLQPQGPSVSGARFTLLNADAFSVTIDPCAPELERLGITHFAFHNKPNEAGMPCLALAASIEESDVWIYERK